jgi:prolyl-tRNA editing enzyme YbaK/EbsC (Cys-tRNA(Pro) deacylase)
VFTAKGSKRVSEYLEEKGIEARVVKLDESTRTSQLAADALGCTVAEIAKSIVFKAGEQAVVVVISGDRRVDAKKVSSLLGEKVGNADADTVKAYGLRHGGVPPFHDPTVKVLLDRADSFEESGSRPTRCSTSASPSFMVRSATS